MKKVTIVLHVQENEEDTTRGIKGAVQELCSTVFLDLGKETSIQSIQVEETSPIKEYTLNFDFKGISYSHKFTPTEQDFWEAFEIDGVGFDVNYCEEHNHISVYEVENGETLTNKESVYFTNIK